MNRQKKRLKLLTQINQIAKQPVMLLAVSKKQSVTAISELAQAGQTDFGENYLQEALEKMPQLSQFALVWHYIGHIQRNKTRDIASHFAWVHSVDRLLIAQRLSQQRPEDMPALNVCLQVNIDAEDSKSGCLPSELPSLVQHISQLHQINLRGLMIIPKNSLADVTDDSGQLIANTNLPTAQNPFTRTKLLFNSLKQHHAHPDQWDTLSMGMSGDMLTAIDAGATMVRVGTALFGVRT